MKAVEAFLVDGEAESYRGVSVLFIDDGRDPVMTLYSQSTGEEHRSIQLKDFETEEALKDLMKNLGFSKRTKKEYETYKERQEKIQADMDIENEHRRYQEMDAMETKKDMIAERVLKMMNENMKKELTKNEEIMRQ